MVFSNISVRYRQIGSQIQHYAYTAPIAQLQASEIPLLKHRMPSPRAFYIILGYALSISQK
jgi:hypothetical protein